MSTWRDYPATASVRLGPFAARAAAPPPPEREKDKGEGYVADWNSGRPERRSHPRQKRRELYR